MPRPIMFLLQNQSIMMRKKQKKTDKRLRHKPNIRFKQNDQKL